MDEEFEIPTASPAASPPPPPPSLPPPPPEDRWEALPLLPFPSPLLALAGQCGVRGKCDELPDEGKEEDEEAIVKVEKEEGLGFALTDLSTVKVEKEGEEERKEAHREEAEEEQALDSSSDEDDIPPPTRPSSAYSLPLPLRSKSSLAIQARPAAAGAANTESLVSILHPVEEK